MKRKFVIALALFTLLSSTPLIYGCGTDDTNNPTNNTEDTANKNQDGVKDDMEKVGEGVKESAEGIVDGAKDVGRDIKYTAINFKDDIVNAGHNLKESAETHWDKFTGKETDYYAGDDLVRVYEYDSKDALDKDVARISSNGLSIDGEAVYKEKPYYYTKGNTLIIYEGKDQTYVDEFNTRYGNPIIP